MKRLFILLLASFISIYCFAQQTVRTKPGMMKFYIIKGTYSFEELYNPNLTLGESKEGFVKSNQELPVIAIDTLQYNFYKVLYKGKPGYIHRNIVVDNSILNSADPEIRDSFRPFVLKNTICLGMNAHEVECALGKPIDINRTVSVNGVNEQWVYNNNVYVYLDDGIVTTFQD